MALKKVVSGEQRSTPALAANFPRGGWADGYRFALSAIGGVISNF
jgi:hypothetical protein